jgi:hypothetical protein
LTTKEQRPFYEDDEELEQEHEMALEKQDKKSGWYNNNSAPDSNGNNNSSNNNGNGKHKGSKRGNNNKQPKQELTKQPKEYSVYKYTKKDGLVEQIQLAGHSKFLQIVNGKPILTNQIDQSEERGLVLKPQLVIGGSPPIMPYQYNDVKEIEYFIDLVSRMHIDDLYFLVKSIWNDVLATENKHLIALLAADTVTSYFQEMFITTHYMLVTGPPGWGKGVILLTFKLLGYRVILAGDMSGANLLDLIGPVEKCQICIAEDELDNIHEDPDKERIYKMGYEDISLVTRTVDPSSSDRTIRLYNPYCMKFFASEKGPDSKELGGFNDRTFRSEVKKGKPKFLVKEIKKQMDKLPERQLLKYRTIIDRINFLRKSLLIYKLLHSNDIIEEINTNIDGRPLELCGPALRLFNSEILAHEDKKALPEVKDALSFFLRKKGELDKKTVEMVIYQVLGKIFEAIDLDIITNECCRKEENKDIHGNSKISYTITYDEICRRVMEEVEGNLISQRTFESADLGTTTHDSILSVCRDVFGGKNVRIGRDKENRKALVFDKQEVVNAGSNFDVVSDIKIFDKVDDSRQGTPEDYRITSMWNEWYNCNGKTEAEAGTNVLISRQYPGIEQTSTPKTIENTHDSENKDTINQSTVHQINDQKLVHKSPNLGKQPKTLDIYQYNGTWYCRHCRLKGDRFLMKEHTCSNSKKKESRK